MTIEKTKNTIIEKDTKEKILDDKGENDTTVNQELVTVLIHKLVRDNTIKIQKEHGFRVKYRKINDTEEFKKSILNKLVEESMEVEYAQSLQELKDELGDVLTVFYLILSVFKKLMKDLNTGKRHSGNLFKRLTEIAKQCAGNEKSIENNKDYVDLFTCLSDFLSCFYQILESENISLEEVATLASRKTMERGGFTKNIFLLSITGEKNHEVIRMLRKKYKTLSKVPKSKV